MNQKPFYRLAAPIVLLVMLAVFLGGGSPAAAQEATPESEVLPDTLLPQEVISGTLEDTLVVPLANGEISSLPPGGWVIETVDSAGNVGEYTSLEVDAAGYPHISYYDRTNGDLKYAYQDASGWYIQTVDSVGDVGRHTSLELDSASNPHISYQDATNKDLRYAYIQRSQWRTQLIEAGNVVHTSLALDINDNPHIAFFKSTSTNVFSVVGDLKYAGRNKGSWKIQIVDTDIGSSNNLKGGSDWLSIQFDNANLPTITYVKPVIYSSYGGTPLSNCRLKYARPTGKGWNLSYLDSGYSPATGYESVGCYPSHAFDASNRLHVSYQNCSQMVLKLKSPYGGVTETSWTGYYTSIALDPAGYEYVSHYESAERDLKLTYRDAAGAYSVVVDFYGDVGLYTSIALDGNGLPVISYYDATNGDLKIARYQLLP